MRTLLVGTDLAYDKNGRLVPIEINTNVGWNRMTQEQIDQIINLTELRTFILNNNFNKMTYIGGIHPMNDKLNILCQELNIEYLFIELSGNITIPYIEDSENHLIIRSSYDITAIVDETYCKDKVGFMNLIKTTSFSSQFAYKDENNNLVSNITDIIDNGVHPNFILKARYVDYDRNVYPKLFRVTNQEELNTVIQNNVNSSYFLMQYHINLDKCINNVVTVCRSLNLLIPPNLSAIPMAGYKKYANMSLPTSADFDPVTFEISSKNRGSYLTGTQALSKPKLLDTDLVLMADGTYKTGLDLLPGDSVMTVTLYENQPYVTDSYEVKSYISDIDTFVGNVKFTTNKITFKTKSNVNSPIATITFDDGTTWKDSAVSMYLVKRGDVVEFAQLSTFTGDGTASNKKYLQIGDQIVLINSNDLVTVEYQVKTVSNIQTSIEFFDGWQIGVENDHLFLTKASNSDDMYLGMYLAIEHNAYCALCFQAGVGNGGCEKVYENCKVDSLTCGDSQLRCLPV